MEQFHRILRGARLSHHWRAPVLGHMVHSVLLAQLGRDYRQLIRPLYPACEKEENRVDVHAECKCVPYQVRAHANLGCLDLAMVICLTFLSVLVD